MSDYIGDFSPNQTIEIELTFKVAPVGLNVEVRKQGSTAVTTTGVALTIPYDSNSKKALVIITTTDAFYAAKNDFFLRASAGTIDGENITDFVLKHFSINNRSNWRLGVTLQHDDTVEQQTATVTDVS